MTLDEHNKRCEIAQLIINGLKPAGRISIDPAINVTLECGVQEGWELCIESPKVRKFFTTLEEMESFVLCHIHNFRLLSDIKILTFEEHFHKNCLRRTFGNLEEKELN